MPADPSTPPATAPPDETAPSRWVFMGLPFIWLIRLYRLTLSPFIGGQCRFYPTCSRYAEDAFRTHNLIYALWLTIRRLLRCHPFGGSGIDEIPPRPPEKAPTPPPRSPHTHRHENIRQRSDEPCETSSDESEVSVHLHQRRPDVETHDPTPSSPAT